jgi:hypothetical protein
MKTQADRVEKLSHQAETLSRETNDAKFQQDFDAFNERWKTTFQKIGMFIYYLASLTLTTILPIFFHLIYLNYLNF